MTLSKSKVNLRLGLKVGGYLRIDDWTSMLLRRYLLLPCRQEMFSATEVQPLLPPPPNSDNEFKPHMLCGNYSIIRIKKSLFVIRIE